jgi:hypothetical protein
MSEKYNNLPYCSKCGRRYSTWIERTLLVKIFLFWLPLKRYMCNNCGRSRHLLRSSPFCE